jgi:hypothetical protein
VPRLPDLFSAMFGVTHLLVTLLTFADVEKLLVDVGAVKLGDQRLQRKKDDDEPSTSGIRQGAPTGDDDDSDWD